MTWRLTRRQLLRAGGVGLGAAALAGTGLPIGALAAGAGGRTFVFFDDHWIDTATGTTRVVHPATKRTDPVMVATEPWEMGISSPTLPGNVYVYGTAVYDPGQSRYRMWYQTYDPAGKYLTLFATSGDGVSWDKPDLGLVEYDGSTANNIVAHDVGDGDAVHVPSVVWDTAASDPSRRYKMMTYAYADSGVPWGSGYSAWFSADGLSWKASASNPEIPAWDVVTTFADPIGGGFVAMTKKMTQILGLSRRTTYVSRSSDYVSWTAQQLSFAADELDDQMAKAAGYDHAEIYGVSTMPYADLYVGFPWVFDVINTNDGVIDAQIAFTRDLTTWNRDDRSPIIPRGASGSFDSSMIFPASTALVIGDRILLYYGGWDGTHASKSRGAAIGLATWRLDGFASLRATGAGTVTTQPFTVDGSRLTANADVGGQGSSLQVEALDADGTPLPGLGLSDSIALRRDAVDAEVRWRSGKGLGDVRGRQARLRFHLTGGDLYAFRVT